MPVAQWLADKKPDVLFFIFNDHITSFFFDHYSAFSLGIGDSYDVADEGGGARVLPPIRGHPGLSAHLGAALMADEFDMSFFQHRPLDHGCFSPLSLMLPHEPSWPAALVPLQVGVLQFPIPTARRCYRLGQSLRRAIESYPEDIRSRSSPPEDSRTRCTASARGSTIPNGTTSSWTSSRRPVERDADDACGLVRSAVLKVRRSSCGWRCAARCRTTSSSCTRTYYLPFTTAMTVVVFEERDPAARSVAAAPGVRAQLDGMEDIEGTYPFDVGQSIRTLRMNRFLWSLTVPAHRELFRADPDAAFEKAALTNEEREFVRRRDWRGMIHYGVNFFGLEKLARVDGISNAVVYAGMRGESLDDFLKTRNMPGAR